MRQTTKSPGEKLVKDIKRATIARQGIAQQCPERVEALHLYEGWGRD
jgi:hypothetical protein